MARISRLKLICCSAARALTTSKTDAQKAVATLNIGKRIICPERALWQKETALICSFVLVGAFSEYLLGDAGIRMGGGFFQRFF